MIDQQSIKVPFWPSGAMLYIPGAGSLQQDFNIVILL